MLPGVIQVWFTMGETRRANQAEERAYQAAEQARQERERADQAAEQARQAAERVRQAKEHARQLESELWKASLVEIRGLLVALTAEVVDIRRRLDERDAAAAKAD